MSLCTVEAQGRLPQPVRMMAPTKGGADVAVEVLVLRKSMCSSHLLKVAVAAAKHGQPQSPFVPHSLLSLPATSTEEQLDLSPEESTTGFQDAAVAWQQAACGTRQSTSVPTTTRLVFSLSPTYAEAVSISSAAIKLGKLTTPPDPPSQHHSSHPSIWQSARLPAQL